MKTVRFGVISIVNEQIRRQVPRFFFLTLTGGFGMVVRVGMKMYVVYWPTGARS